MGIIVGFVFLIMFCVAAAFSTIWEQDDKHATRRRGLGK